MYKAIDIDKQNQKDMGISFQLDKHFCSVKRFNFFRTVLFITAKLSRMYRDF